MGRVGLTTHFALSVDPCHGCVSAYPSSSLELSQGKVTVAERWVFLAKCESIFTVEKDACGAEYLDFRDSEIRRVGLSRGRPDRYWMMLRVERG